MKPFMIFFIIMVLVIILGCVILKGSAEPVINLEAIKQIESRGNPRAFNKRTQARGLYQITPICLEEYNNYNSPEYSTEDLFNPATNKKIASWYLTERIPQMLKYYGKPVTVRNQIVSYNAGISYVVSDKELPQETKDYLIKYQDLTRGTNESN